MALPSRVTPDLEDVLGEDHLLAADPTRITRRRQIAREHPDAVGRVRDDFGDGSVD
jgi:hypothetical protein